MLLLLLFCAGSTWCCCATPEGQLWCGGGADAALLQGPSVPQRCDTPAATSSRRRLACTSCRSCLCHYLLRPCHLNPLQLLLLQL